MNMNSISERMKNNNYDCKWQVQRIYKNRLPKQIIKYKLKRNRKIYEDYRKDGMENDGMVRKANHGT